MGYIDPVAPIIYLGLAALGLLAVSKPAAASSGRTLAEGPPPTPPQPSPPDGYRRATGADTITAMMRENARAALPNPIGTLLPFDGYAIQLEWHFHEPEGPVKPWGWHKGATVYIKS